MTKDQLLTQLKEEILKVQALPGEIPRYPRINTSGPDSILESQQRYFLAEDTPFASSDYNFRVTKANVHFIPTKHGCFETPSWLRHLLTCKCWTKSRNGQWKHNPDHRVGECPFREHN
jgi:hypothetical protein